MTCSHAFDCATWRASSSSITAAASVAAPISSAAKPDLRSERGAAYRSLTRVSAMRVACSRFVVERGR
jgi:hypothetical protein